MAMMRSLLGAKKILGRSVSAASTSKTAAERVSCCIRRRGTKEEICGANLILEPPFFSSSSQ
ncbi:hypothetical protein F2Q69_00044614 [Brassica cretica]|uniref:Uncharacterized protein n=1 Tax=Brassica cretica TaxID=69181 RepID=A0A8S9NIU9_BRACR|nr:hypothetical protein F2Q69_00044614 [Brassica cretica]